MPFKTASNILIPLFGSLPLPVILISFVILAIASIIALTQLEKYRLHFARQHKGIRIPFRIHIMRFITSLIVMVSIIYVVASFNIACRAYAHGCREYMKQDINGIIQSIKHSPKEDTIIPIPNEGTQPVNPEKLSNVTIIYYRFGCKDCEKLYKQLSSKFDNLSDVYWICTRSDYGKELQKIFPVKNVPFAIYITEPETAVGFELYTKTKLNDKTIISLNTAQIEQLLKFRKNHNKKGVTLWEEQSKNNTTSQ